MWFKNAHIFSFDEPFPYNAKHFAERLQQRSAKPCPKTQAFIYGWGSPYGQQHNQLVHESQSCLLFTLVKEERVLPPSIVQETLEEKIKSITEKEQREIYAKERSRLRDEIIFSLLPQAFTKKTYTHALIDLERQWLIVDVGSRSKAETLTEFLRNTLGSLKITPLQTTGSASQTMNRWLLHNELPSAFEFGGDCEMRDKEKDRGSIRFSQLQITTPEVTNHLKHHRRLAKLECIWEKRIAFVLNDDASLSRIRFLDVIKEELEELDQPDGMQQFEATFALMSLELRACLTTLFQAMSNKKAAEIVEFA